MAHQRLCKVCRDWHDLDAAWPVECLPPEPKRSDLACPAVIGDTMAPVQSMASGQVYDSKSALRSEYRQLGMIEVGNDAARHRPVDRPKASRQHIKDTVQKAEARFNRGERASQRPAVST